MYGYLEKGIQTLMAQGRSTQIVLMIRWIRTSRLSMTDSLSSQNKWDAAGATQACIRVIARRSGGQPSPLTREPSPLNPQPSTLNPQP